MAYASECILNTSSSVFAALGAQRRSMEHIESQSHTMPRSPAGEGKHKKDRVSPLSNESIVFLNFPDFGFVHVI